MHQNRKNTFIMKQMCQMLLLPEMATGEAFTDGTWDCFTNLLVTGNWTSLGCSFTLCVSFGASEGRRLLPDLKSSDKTILKISLHIKKNYFLERSIHVIYFHTNFIIHSILDMKNIAQVICTICTSLKIFSSHRQPSDARVPRLATISIYSHLISSRI